MSAPIRSLLLLSDNFSDLRVCLLIDPMYLGNSRLNSGIQEIRRYWHLNLKVDFPVSLKLLPVG